MAPNLKNQPWWMPTPLTEDQMQSEIHSSSIRGSDHQEFSDADVSATLKALNLNKFQNDRPANQS